MQLSKSPPAHMEKKTLSVGPRHILPTYLRSSQKWCLYIPVTAYELMKTTIPKTVDIFTPEKEK